MKTTEEQRAELRRKQQEATPGPWRLAGTDMRPYPVVGATHHEKGYQVQSMLHVKGDAPDVWPSMRDTYCRDAAFIAAANPDAVGFLLDDVDSLHEQVRDLQIMLDRSRQNEREHLDNINRLTREGVEAREQARTLTAERDDALQVIGNGAGLLTTLPEAATGLAQVSDALRARVAELEIERDAAQQRVKTARGMANLLFHSIKARHEGKAMDDALETVERWMECEEAP